MLGYCFLPNRWVELVLTLGYCFLPNCWVELVQQEKAVLCDTDMVHSFRVIKVCIHCIYKVFNVV